MFLNGSELDYAIMDLFEFEHVIRMKILVFSPNLPSVVNLRKFEGISVKQENGKF